MLQNSGRIPKLLLSVWLLLAIALGRAGVISSLSPPWPQGVLFALTAGAFAAVQWVPDIRRWIETISTRSLVSLHLIRLIAGGYFLVLERSGSLAREFAIPAGVGDILVALFALGLLVTLPPGTGKRRQLYVAWNVFGLIDILFVVANAARVALVAPSSMQQLLRLPLSLLPTFIVPLIIVSHLILFRRLRAMHRP